MKKSYLLTLVFCVIITGSLSFNSAYAKQGAQPMGQGQRMMMHNQLDQKTIDAMQNERTAFFNATADLRNDVYRKNLELQAEFAAKNPDAAKIKNLQKDISDLEADLAQKRVDHELKMKKINPNYRIEMMRGHGMMMGMGGKMNCPMMGSGNMMMDGGMMMNPGMKMMNHQGNMMNPGMKTINHQNH